MKICLLGDTHFGVRNDSRSFHNYYEKFYSELFFPYLLEHNIKDIIQLGDLFDRRKYVNFLTLSESKRYFFDKVQQHNFNMIALLGNHDIFWKESLAINSPELLLSDYNNIHIVHDAETISIKNVNIDFVPWICKENEVSVLEFINQSSSNICVGHFELAGFDMMKGIPNHDGKDSNFLNKYKHVFSGHYHTSSSKGNISYLGTPYQLTWIDYGDPKGFYIFDTDTNELEFVQNNYEMFVKYYYNETKEDPRSIDTSFMEDKIVKLIVVDKKDFSLFDNFVERIYKRNPIELKIIEDLSDFETSAIDDNLNLEDTMTLLSEYVEGLETDADKQRIKTLLKELYVEAHDYEDT